MSIEEIETYSKLIGNVIGLAILFSWKYVARHMLRNDPDNMLLPLYYMRYVKLRWKALYFVIATLCFIAITFSYGGYNPVAIIISTGVSIYIGTAILKSFNKNIWEDDIKPTLDDQI